MLYLHKLEKGTRGERGFLKKAWQKILYGDGDGILFVQVDLLTNFAPSLARRRLFASGSHEFSLLNSGFRTLRFVIAAVCLRHNWCLHLTRFFISVGLL